jgi:hypothetical protein
VVSLLQPTLIASQSSYCCQDSSWSAFFSQHSLLVSHLNAAKIHRGQPSSANTHCWSAILLLPSSSWSAFFSQHIQCWSAILLLPSSSWSAFFSQHSHRWSAILLLPSSSWSAIFNQRSYRRPVITLLPNRVVSSPLLVFSRRIHRWLVTTTWQQ